MSNLLHPEDLAILLTAKITKKWLRTIPGNKNIWMDNIKNETQIFMKHLSIDTYHIQNNKGYLTGQMEFITIFYITLDNLVRY